MIWASVVDGGPTTYKLWVNVSCLLVGNTTNTCIKRSHHSTSTMAGTDLMPRGKRWIVKALHFKKIRWQLIYSILYKVFHVVNQHPKCFYSFNIKFKGGSYALLYKKKSMTCKQLIQQLILKNQTTGTWLYITKIFYPFKLCLAINNKMSSGLNNCSLFFNLT